SQFEAEPWGPVTRDWCPEGSRDPLAPPGRRAKLRPILRFSPAIPPSGGRLSVERIAVLGAGIMGRGIAYAAAVSGYGTRLYDAVPGALEKGLGDIQKLMDQGVAAGKLAAEARDRAA